METHTYTGMEAGGYHLLIGTIHIHYQNTGVERLR